jgi:hypothetical protein
MRLRNEQNLYFVLYLALSKAETLRELYTEVSPFQYPSDCLVSSKHRLYRNNGPPSITPRHLSMPFFWGGVGAQQPKWAKAASLLRFLNHTHTFGRTPLKEWSARRRGRYLHNTQHTQDKTSTTSTGFESAISGKKAGGCSTRPQTTWPMASAATQIVNP